MKRIMVMCLLIGMILISGCAPGAVSEPSGFTEPDPETYVSLMPSILEYFHYRKEAVITGDMDSFYARYPTLQGDGDIAAGVNAEAFFVENMQGLAPFDGDIHPEYYHKIRVRRSGEEAQVLLHGMELYLWKNEEGAFDRSGGEFKLVLFMRQAGEGWDVYRTDEVTLAEWKSFDD